MAKFMKKYRKGTLHGNMFLNRYSKYPEKFNKMKRVVSNKRISQFDEIIKEVNDYYHSEYGGRKFDWLLIVSIILTTFDT